MLRIDRAARTHSIKIMEQQHLPTPQLQPIHFLHFVKRIFSRITQWTSKSRRRSLRIEKQKTLLDRNLLPLFLVPRLLVPAAYYRLLCLGSHLFILRLTLHLLLFALVLLALARRLRISAFAQQLLLPTFHHLYTAQ